MKKFRNPKETKKLGVRIAQLRVAAGYNIADIADMTGFSYQTISNIEKGVEATVSYIIEIAKAINVHPKELFDIKFEKQPRFKLSPQRKEKNRFKQSIDDLLENSDFFNTPQFVRDVLKELNFKASSKAESVIVSTALTRMVTDGRLKFNLVGRQKQYYKRKK